MKRIIYILFFVFPIYGLAQSYADKSYYLIDSLNLDALSETDYQLIDSCLKIYHNTKDETSKINALTDICENMEDDSWIKYQYYQYHLIEQALKKNHSVKTTNQLKISLSKALNNIGFIFDNNGDVEKALDYYNKSLKVHNELNNKSDMITTLSNMGSLYLKIGESKQALSSYNKSLKLSQEIDDKGALASNLNNIASVLQNQGEISKAISYYQRSIKIRKEIKDFQGLSINLLNVGSIYKSQGDIPKALEYFHKSLEIWEDLVKENETDLNLQEMIATGLNNIGGVYLDQGDLTKSLEYYNQSLEIRKKTGVKQSIANSLANIGGVYKKQGDMLNALEYYQKSLLLLEEIGFKKGIAITLSNIGFIHKAQKDFSKALEYYNKSLEINESIGNKEGIAISLANLGILYYNQENINKAKEYGERSLALGKEIGFPDEIKGAAKLLSNVYQKQGNYKAALEMYKLHIQMRDSLNNEDTQKAAAKQQAKYEYEKQKAIDDAEHEKQLAIEQEAKAKQKILTYATAGGLGLVGIFLIFVFNRLKVTRKQKSIIEQAHAELGEKNQEILDSINYAKRIQNAILPPNKVVKEYLPNSFILYKPKDIVAGDFYWMETVNSVEGGELSDEKPTLNTQHTKTILFAAADCTGHGVPGAMVSVVCNNGLNRSVREHKLTDLGKILDKTREIVVAEFEKSEEDVKDGMDIALCSLRLNVQGSKLKDETLNPKPESAALLQYAGAHNPLWIIRNNANEMEEIKADKQPIGKTDNPQPYTTHKIELNQGDTIYIFSDGYADQFGGEQGKKMKTTNFKKLLLSIKDENMQKQRELIDEAFESWKGNLEQLDDVCVIGVRV